MPFIERSAGLARSSRILYMLFTLLFWVASLYYQDNLGGEGLSLPFNAVIWVPVLLIIGAALLINLRTKLWVKPRFLGLIALFPLGVLLSGFLSGMERPGEWLVRLGVLIGGMLFWFALLQYRMKRRDLENLLYLLLAALLLHAMVGLIQIAPEPILKGWLPVASGAKFLGMFQQPNLQASMMATALALAVYLISLPGFRGQRWPMKMLVFMTLLLATLEVVGSGSRVGLLGAGVALLILLLARIKPLLRLPRYLLLIFVTLGVASWAGLKVSDGALHAYSKVEQMAESGKDARPHIYRIALDVFIRSPLVGHGIGSFQREFQNQRVDYAQQRDASAISGAPRFSHPHNELLFWMDEGGLVALAAILAGALAVALQLIRLGWQRGGALAALLLPITLHTQVELPFYISTLHWLVLLVLLAVCFVPGSQPRPVQLSGAAQRLLLATVFIVVPGLSTFLAHSLLSQTSIMQYLKGRGAQPQHLNYALNNLYFRETGEYFTMRALLYSALHQQQPQLVSSYISWAEGFVEQIPDIQIYKDLAVAYQSQGEVEKSLNIIARAHAIYPGDAGIAEVQRKLQAGEALISSAVKSETAADQNSVGEHSH